ncbi:hypothetical protein QUA82_18150 [Microcoleus sp. F8-D3]
MNLAPGAHDNRQVDYDVVVENQTEQEGRYGIQINGGQETPTAIEAGKTITTDCSGQITIWNRGTVVLQVTFN